MKEQPKKTENRGIGNFHPTPPSSQGKNYLFSIGIDDYHNFPPLHNCVKDATDIAKLLTDRYQFEKENIISLYNEDATTDNIFLTFEKLAGKIRPVDSLVVYFAGHGEYKEVFKEGYWIPINAAANRTSQFIPNSEIKTMLTAINTKHTFVIVDSCFSGSLFARGSSRNLAERVEKIPSRWGLTSGRSEIVADGVPGVNSPFASSILYLLKNNTKQLGVQELCAHVIESVVATATQTPIGEPLTIPGHRGGQFFFKLKKNEIRDWKETQEANSINAYQSYLSLYPDGKNIEAAKNILSTMEEEKLWAEATEENTITSYMAYRMKYSNGKYIDNAIEFVEDLEDKRDWAIACRKNLISAYLKYKRTYPNGDHLLEADEKIKNLQIKKPIEVSVAPVEENKMEPVIEEAIYSVVTPDQPDIIYENNSDTSQKNSLVSKLILFGIPLFIIAMFAISRFMKTSPTGHLSNKNAEPIEEKNVSAETFEKEENNVVIDKTPLDEVEKTIPANDNSENQIAANQLPIENTTTTKVNTTKPPTAAIKKDNPIVSDILTEKPAVTRRKAVIKKLEQNMVYLGGGNFAMGASNLPDAPIHEVKITRGFSISKTEITQELWKAVMRSNPSINSNCGPQCPVENVSFYEVQDFLKKLNKFTGKKYRLPTEAEWEYAAIAGQSNDLRFQHPANLSSLAYYNGNTQSIKPVDQKLSNKRGISDMLGNVAEWCEDWYAEDFYKDEATNPINKRKGMAASKVIRGGSFMSRENKCSIYFRDAMSPNSRKKYIGFRVVLN